MIKSAASRILRKALELVEGKSNVVAAIDNTNENFGDIVKQMKAFEKNAMIAKITHLEKRVAELVGYTISQNEQIKTLTEVVIHSASATEELVNTFAMVTEEYQADDAQQEMELMADDSVTTQAKKKLSIN